MFVKSPCIFLDHSELGNFKKNYFNSSMLRFLEQFVIILPITALLLLAEVNVYKKNIFPYSRTCRHEFCYEKMDFYWM